MNMGQRLFGIFFLLLVVPSCKENREQQTVVHPHTNALAQETSPYLLQHAHNPVNWRPWSQEALEEAKKEDKLVLISIGYSSCHWCHVMEAETFEDEEVARLMNENFINIKVDREERPDIDNIYQTFVQLIQSNSGWPLNVIVLPNGKPIYGSTYHTKAHWLKVLSKVNDAYKNDPKKATEYAEQIAKGIQAVNRIAPAKGHEPLTREALRSSVEGWKPFWDLEWGGDKGSQKFIIPGNLGFLMDYALLTQDEFAKAHLKHTLDQIIRGGIYDQVGGGFFRYSTDKHWKVPHFEKMLYDNAQAIGLFSKAFIVFGEPEYRNVVLETLTFLDDVMRHEPGGYYAAIDADSEGVEGKFYTWEATELKSILKDDFELFARYYNVNEKSVRDGNTYILHKLISDVDFSKENNVSRDVLVSSKKRWKDKLLRAQEKRIRPQLDDKILTSWNALLISGFVQAYKAFGQKEHLEKAENLFTFLTEHSYRKGELLHSYKAGSRPIPGFLEDYAFLSEAALELYGSTLDTHYLDFARTLVNMVQQDFSDRASGMYYYSKNSKLISRIIKTDDGVLPSPNAVMAHNLFKLGHLLYDTEFLEQSKSMLSAMVPSIQQSAPSYAKWNGLLLHTTYPYYEVAVVGDNALPLVKQLHQKALANTLVVGSLSESGLPLFKNRYQANETYIFVCRNTTCKLPVRTVEEALMQLQDL